MRQAEGLSSCCIHLTPNTIKPSKKKKKKAAHPCLHMNDLSRLLTNLSTHTLRDFSPHRASKARLPPQSKTFSRGAFIVLHIPSAYCPHNQINTAANSSRRRTHPINRGESRPCGATESISQQIGSRIHGDTRG